jgi:hypothetical protein
VPSPRTPKSDMKQTRTTQAQNYTRLALAASLVILSAVIAAAQNPAESRSASLRTQLAHVQEQQDQLQTRLRQLDEDLKPENIEKSLAGVGSTHPEDLREQRRRQLEIEKTSVQTKLDLLATSRTRLETGIAQADADVYRQSAAPNTGTTNATTTQSSGARAMTSSTTIRRRTRRTNRKRSKPRRVSQGKLISADCADYTD